MKFIDFWIVMSMITAGYGLAAKENLTNSDVAVIVIAPFLAWPLIVGAEIYETKTSLIDNKEQQK